MPDDEREDGMMGGLAGRERIGAVMGNGRKNVRKIKKEVPVQRDCRFEPELVFMG